MKGEKINAQSRFWVGLICLIIMLSFVLTGCSSAKQQPAASGTEQQQAPQIRSNIVIAAASKGGPWNNFSMEWTQDLATIPGVKSVAILEGGAVDNLKTIDEGKDSFVGFTHAPLFHEARAGTLFDKPTPNVLGICAVGISVQQYTVKKDSPIKTFADLKDKNLLPGAKAQGSELLFARLLAEYGLDYDKVKAAGGNVSFTSFGDMVSLMGDGHADLAVVSGDVPHASAMEMNASFDIRLLEVPQDIIDKINAKYPGYVEYTVPANAP